MLSPTLSNWQAVAGRACLALQVWVHVCIGACPMHQLIYNTNVNNHDSNTVLEKNPSEPYSSIQVNGTFCLTVLPEIPAPEQSEKKKVHSHFLAEQLSLLSSAVHFKALGFEFKQ